MKTAMAFGTFDILHPGHINFLRQAKTHAPRLVVIIARDSTVKQVKGETAKHSEKQRLRAVKGLNLADIVILGNLGDKYAIIKKYRPDIICLGYDQTHFVGGLKDELNKLKLKCKIIRLKPFEPNKYKTSIIKMKKINMSIVAEFSPELALRDIKEFKGGKRKRQECVPEILKPGKIYKFLKTGQRLYWLNDEKFWGFGQMPLVITDGNGQVSRPLASIKILEVTHFLNQRKIYTKGKYKVIDIFDARDQKIHFNSCRRVK